MLMTRLRCLPLALLLFACPAVAADWPQWLGPKRDGSSPEKVKPWKGDLKVLWRQPVGPGHSSPVVAGGKVYLHTRVKDKEAEAVTAYDAEAGTKVWKTSYPRERFFSPFGTGPQATPAVVDGKVYSFGATGILTCFDANGGKQLWQVDTRKTLKVTAKRQLFFGVACSPLVEGDKAVVDVGGEGACIVAFRKDSGEVAWKALDDRASYSSGIAFGKGKERQLVFLTQQGVRSLAPADGKVFWRFPLVDKLNESSTTPVHVDDLLLASSVTYGMVGLQLGEKDGKPAGKQLWYHKELTCYFSTPIPVGKGHVYLVTGVISFLKPSSTLRCVEIKTGKEVWNKPNVGKYHAAMLRTADDKLLMLSDLGDLVLIDPSPKGYKELARSKVVKKEQIWAHPALSNGRIYLRDEKELICLQLPE
jgi:outer membrane protein assembly factor BamB